jgi:hypothetical protein
VCVCARERESVCVVFVDEDGAVLSSVMIPVILGELDSSRDTDSRL